MYNDDCFLLKNRDELRRAIAEGGLTSRQQALWNMMKSCTRSGVLNFPWYAPFVAVMTEEKQDIDNAKKVIATYIDKLKHQNYCVGLQFHFWCFAFPHAKWAMYYQWLVMLGAYTEAERAELDAEFVNYQFTNYYYGMKTKPEPECVDNQTLSLTLSNVLVGYLFSDTHIGKLMLRDGLKRLPEIIGGFPESGYTGEGSDYMDCVNGPAMWICCEALEQITGEKDVVFKRFAPNEVRPIDVLDVCAREWMPGGLLLPWDNYGYNNGVKAPVAYAAKKTGNKRYYDILEQDAIWSYDIGTGWAYDDMVWALIFWPVNPPSVQDSCESWCKETIGGALMSSDREKYLMQMWDESGPVCPTRSHVNPNAVLFNAYRTPISADGSKMNFDCTRFDFEDTWRVVDFLSMDSETRYNFGDGCVGTHSCVLVDNYEGMRAKTEYLQTQQTDCDPEKGYLSANVTPIYRDNFADAVRIERKSSLHCDRFFLVEDSLEFTKEHELTSRFLFRPFAEKIENGVKITTPESVTLQLIDVFKKDDVRIEDVKNYPHKPDLYSVIVDFSHKEKKMKRLLLAFPSKKYGDLHPLTEFRAVSDPQTCYTLQVAKEKLAKSELFLNATLPAFMEKQTEIEKTWWYEKEVCKEKRPAYLILPAGLIDPALYLNGKKIDLEPYKISMQLVRPHILLDDALTDVETLDVVLRTNVPTDHFYGKGWGTYGLNTGIDLAYAQPEETVQSVVYDGKKIKVTTDLGEYCSDYCKEEA